MAEKKKMSVAEMLAAARKADGGGGDGESAPPSEEKAPAKATAKPAAKKPAAKAAAKGGERPGVADILAAARGGKSGASPAVVAPPKKEAAEKPAAKKSASPSAKPAAKKAPSGPMETASILAAARTAPKPGPISKAEAAKQQAAAGTPAKAKLAPPPMPPKPEYAKPKPEPKVDHGRRSALLGVLVGSSLSLGFSALAATIGLWTLGLVRFMFPNILREPPSRFRVGSPDNFAPGQVETKFKATYGVWVVNSEYNGESQIYALMSVCTHLGCTPNWLEAEQKFKCPCHGSGFYKDGINFEGPAPRPLERYAIHIADDGQLEIDKSQTFQEEMGEWNDPDSFVVV